MDASEFKEYIFRALFLKRASDVFDEERRQVIEGQIALSRSHAEAERRADDPDFNSDAFFVPAEARWPRLSDELHHQVGDGLNKALGALEEHNPSMEGVLQSHRLQPAPTCESTAAGSWSGRSEIIGILVGQVKWTRFCGRHLGVGPSTPTTSVPLLDPGQKTHPPTFAGRCPPWPTPHAILLNNPSV